MSEETLEQQVEGWVANLFRAAVPPNPEQREAIHRFLQLARREGARAWLAPHVVPREEALRQRFPIRRTVTRPNVLPDPHGIGEWTLDPEAPPDENSVFLHRRFPHTFRHAAGWRVDGLPAPTPARVRTLARLLDEPTVTETVDE